MSQVAGQHRRAVGGDRPLRRRRAALVLLHLQAAVGRLPVLDGRRSARRSGSSCCSCGTRTASTCCTRTPTGSRRASTATRPSRPSSTAGRCPACSDDRRRSSASGSTTSTRPPPGRAIAEFVDELSNWYVRRSRRRFWDGDPAAFATLRTALVTVAQLLAPFCRSSPTRSTTTSTAASRAFTCRDFPAAGERDLALEQAMAIARETVRLGLAARAQAKLKVRQPLRAAVVVATGAERERDRAARRRSSATSSTSASCGSSPRPTSSARSRSSRTTGRSGRGSASRCRWSRPRSPASIRPTWPPRSRDGEPVAIDVGGHDHELGADDLLVAMKPLEGYQVEREGSHAVALELEIDERAAGRGPGARDRPRRPDRAQGRRPRGLRPDRADARRRRRAARRRPRAPGLHRRRDARDERRLRTARRGRAGADRRARAADRRRPRLTRRQLSPGHGRLSAATSAPASPRTRPISTSSQSNESRQRVIWPSRTSKRP